ncbi:Origin of replication complex subunit 2 [Vitis vinifera]|uniref:Origin recognition complex subunit 2 n=1 Tax=Vitis vinifera TaxID=29760 RepID=A0A438G3C5_VITVI|nr:Origin of replication complex subunit 2 [Vitis vinifera]
MEGNYGEDEEFGFARNYFIAKELGGSGKKSSRKLSDIELVDEQELRAAARSIESKHEKEIASLLNSYKSLYPKWVFELRCGFGLLMYGFGSKKALIEDFASTALTECAVVVINGYLQSINIKQGGLGVRSLVLLNKALLCKWSWRFAVEREALWRQVISAKYGEEEGGWRSCVVRGSYGVGLWKAIRRGWEAVGLGSGCMESFWRGVWAPRFSRRINDWEVIEVERLLLRLQGRRVYSDVEDEVIWTKAKDGRFSVKSLYKDLDPERREEFPANIIWNSLVPPRAVTAIAEALWDQLKTRRTPLGDFPKVQQPFNSRSMDDLLAFMDGSHSKKNDCFVCVVIHNIDGPGLRDSDTQQYLARVAACSHIRMVASIDHVNAPLWMPVNNLYSICRERFLVSSQITLNSHLTEFKDHELIKTRRHSDGQDCLYIPLATEALEKLLQDISQ